MRVLTWPGMPAAAALDSAGRRLGVEVDVTIVSSNERLEAELEADRFDVVFPSDYLVQRLRTTARLLPLDTDELPLHRLAPWAVDASYDPGCRFSVPFAYGTTGLLRGSRAAGALTWAWLLAPPAGTSVGMLDELREVVGAALISLGRSPNDASPTALHDAQELLLAQRPHVGRYDSDDFCQPVLLNQVVAHQAWSGPAAHAIRRSDRVSFVVPNEGAVLWTTTAAIPTNAPDPDRSLRLIAELMDPEFAALTTAQNGYATPNRAARALLPAALGEDPVLFPDAETRGRCHVLTDLGAAEARFAEVWRTLRPDVTDGRDS